MLNELNHDLYKYSSDFNTKGYTVIDSLLDVQLIDKWCNQLQQKEDKYWTQIIKNSELEKDFNVIDEKEDIIINHNKALINYNEGRFCFSFKRIIEPIQSGDVIEEIISYISSRNFLQILSKIALREIEKISVFYINRFDKGDFLTTHSDSGNSIGIVINLTKSWNPNFGGMTFMLNPDNNEINVIVPKLGRLLVFDIIKNNVPHFVSMVTSHSNLRRLAIVARYD